MHLKKDMFSTIALIGTFSLLNMRMPFSVSATERICGVVTITDPDIDSF